MTVPLGSKIGNKIGSGKEAEVFAFGAHAAKLYRQKAVKAAAFREAATIAMVEQLGLPLPHVHGVIEIDARWAVLMDRVAGPTLADRLRGKGASIPDLLAAMAALHRRIHNCDAPGFPELKQILARNIGRATQLDDARRLQLLAGLASMPNGERLCHGDFHPMNIMGEPGGEIVLDWVDAAAGDPAADVCRSYLLMQSVMPSLAAAYVDAYATASGLTQPQILAWLPYLAAARLAENVPDEDARLLDLASQPFGWT